MKIISTLLILFSCFSLTAQHDRDVNKGTIKVQKKGALVKVVYDNVNYMLVAIDRYGNVVDSAVVEFEMSVTIKGIFYNEKTIGNKLTYAMQQQLGKSDQATKIYFDKIKAKDKNGILMDMKKIVFTLGNPAENPD